MLRFVHPTVCTLAALVFSASPLLAAAPSADLFVPSATPPLAAAVYHDGWIDLNKNGARDPYEDSSRPIDARIEDLLARMSLEEKTAQLTTLYGFPRVLKDERPTSAWREAMWKDGIGNIDEHLNGNTGWTNNLADPVHDLPWSLHARALNEVQRWFIEQTRLGIPVDFTNEGIRGLLHSKATSFPAELAVASTWDPALVREIGRITGREARALGYTNIYSPVLDLARDPRWGRTIETYGEDPFLVGTLGVEQVRGLQAEHVVSTLKHFAVYSIPKGGRDGEARTDPQATWREVQTIFLEPFRRAIREAGALGVMASYNDYDGVPVEGSALFLSEILRGQWGFRGYVVSDSAAVEFIHSKHRVAPTPADAIRQAVEAGLNIRTNFTPPAAYAEPLRQLVRDGKLAMATIDARVRDVLRVKFQLGLFDRPYVADPAAADRVVRAPEHLVVAQRAGREAIVLLKNEPALLPLDRAKLQRVLVAGPLADDAHAWWSRYGAQRLDFVTPLPGLRAKLGAAVEVRYAKGVEAKDAAWPASDVLKDPPSAEVRAGIEAAVAAAQNVDVIIAVLGETDELCRESSSRISLALPGYQQELLEALHATGKPLVLVLSNGRPLSVVWAARHVPAIVELWFPGEDGGAALAAVLLGDANPSGRLPITFPQSVGQLPYNFPAHPGSQARDFGQVEGSLFPFGHGLSYTTFRYSDLRITPERIPVDGFGAAGGGDPGLRGSASRATPYSVSTVPEFTITCDVTNTGTRAGDEVVQLYLRDDYSSVTTYDIALRGFARVTLAPGETKPVTFTLHRAHLELYNRDGDWVVEPGRFTVMLGASSADIRLRGTFTVTAADGSAPEEAPVVDPRLDPR
ncbi:glycoside hydrolase family 3 N-terminal domain-containing protein [Opitutus terrae]|uniref:Glycoside hydrolase family 3 domain protein n=1 Tax=Opitutus terrae (strain DSM 11246 / JCM 15787 / PB90-1) TaxID=452637 RepID=B1ZRY4_OPITP|nr:glycoside hydrolase family 3 N-terminal domain-containing protein [Opitutus terrae]ACB74660.1 glycoside hydrolase family 3 domain protein [Opitutus terrae PB90-1]